MGRILAASREEAKSGLGWLLGLTFAIFIGAVGIPTGKQEEWLGASGRVIFDTAANVLIIIFLALALALAIKIVMRLRPSRDPVPRVPRSRFHCRVIETVEEARHINVDLVHLVFPDAPLPPDEGLASQKKNSKRIIGLIETHTDHIVGWASLWPVSEKTGRQIESGKCNDDDLTAADLLPEWRNGSAKYLVLRAFAVLPDYRRERESLALKLGRFVLVHIVDEFLRSSDRAIRLLAIAYTEEGGKLCRMLGLTGTGCFADYGPPQGKKPVFAASVTMKELCRRLGDS